MHEEMFTRHISNIIIKYKFHKLKIEISFYVSLQGAIYMNTYYFIRIHKILLESTLLTGTTLTLMMLVANLTNTK